MTANARVVVALLITSVLAPAAAAAWAPDGVPVCTVGGAQRFPLVVTDDAGGAFIVWHDQPGSAQRLFVQHLMADGSIDAGWPVEGDSLPRKGSSQAYPAAIADGAGGVIVTWLEVRPPGPYADVYAVRITPSGTFAPGWGDSGVRLSAFASQKFRPSIASDGSGGAIVVWEDIRTTSRDLYGQHVSAGGTILWAAAGQPIVTAPTFDEEPVLVADGAGGAIVVWGDRWAISGNPLKDFHVLRITGAGAPHPAWPAGGVAISNQNPNFSYEIGAVAVTDGAGGAIVVWTGASTVCGNAISATRVDSSGTIAWTGWRNVSGMGCPDWLPCAAPDGVGGVIVAWADTRNYDNTSYDVYAQHLTSNGTALWDPHGLPVSRELGSQYFPAIAADGNGGAFLVWREYRNYPGTSPDIFGQHLLADGSVAPGWLTGGSPVSAATGAQDYVSIVASGTQRAIAVWDDTRVSPSQDIYAGILVDGPPLEVGPDPPVPPSLRLEGFRPNPADGRPSVAFTLPEHEPAVLELFDIAGRRVAMRAVGHLGPGEHAVPLGGDARLRAGVYVIRLVQRGRILVARGVVIR